jgi:hypothetical protein
MGDILSSTSRKKYNIRTWNRSYQGSGNPTVLGGISGAIVGEHNSLNLTSYETNNDTSNEYSYSKTVAPQISIVSGSPGTEFEAGQTVGGLHYKAWLIVAAVAVFIFWFWKRL